MSWCDALPLRIAACNRRRIRRRASQRHTSTPSCPPPHHPHALPACLPARLQTVVNSPATVRHPLLSACCGQPGRRHLVDLEDREDANLLRHLPAALDFIAAALLFARAPAPAADSTVVSTRVKSINANSSGSSINASNVGSSEGTPARVLVHCVQGVSRSAAVAVAHLMRQRQLAPEAALSALRFVPGAAAAAPNPGFVAQLEMFGGMGCQLADGHQPYKRFLLQQVGGCGGCGWEGPGAGGRERACIRLLQLLVRWRWAPAQSQCLRFPSALLRPPQSIDVT